MNNDQKEALSFSTTKSIVIDKKMFYNFLGPLLEPNVGNDDDDENDFKFEDDPLDVER